MRQVEPINEDSTTAINELLCAFKTANYISDKENEFVNVSHFAEDENKDGVF